MKNKEEPLKPYEWKLTTPEEAKATIVTIPVSPGWYEKSKKHKVTTDKLTLKECIETLKVYHNASLEPKQEITYIIKPDTDEK